MSPVASRLDPEAAVRGQRLEHVAEEAVRHRDAPLAAFERERQPHRGLARGALDAAAPLAHGASSAPLPVISGVSGVSAISASARRVARRAAPLPTDTRRQPARPG